MNELIAQSLALVYLVLSAATFCSAAEKAASAKSDSTLADKKALAPFQGLVGEWKGVGQPRRGSSQGSWIEESQWAWRFADGRAEIVAKLDDDPYFGALRLQAGDRAGQFKLIATEPAEKPEDKGATEMPTKHSSAKGEIRFEGTIGADGQLALTIAGEPQPARPARITLRVVAGGDRLVTLYETRSGERFTRLAEIGLTRRGSSFAVKGVGGHECIVTGGQGTIAVEYKGETYYVCCTGCRDLFKQDPEKVLAEYRERKAKEAAESKR